MAISLGAGSQTHTEGVEVMSKFKYRGLAKEAGFIETAPGVFSADYSCVETLVLSAQRKTDVRYFCID